MQGVAVWLWAVVIAIILAILTAIAGSQWDILANLQSLPRIPVTPETATLTGILTALGATVVALIGAILDGLRRGVGGLLRGGAVAESDSGTDRGDQGGQEHCGAHRGQPSEERGSELETAEFCLLTLVDIGAERVIRIDGDGRVRGVLVVDGCARFPGLLGIVAVHTAKVGAHRTSTGGGRLCGSRRALYAGLQSKALS